MLFLLLKKTSAMSNADMKDVLHKQIDALEDNRVAEIFGLINNYLNTQEATDDWRNLTPQQKEGILKAIRQLDAGEGIAHDEVMKSARGSYGRG
jgi:hypothetical protein